MCLPKNTEHANATANAISALTKAMLDDPGYAWTWHCTIAYCAMDSGAASNTANEAAERFMRLAFGLVRSQYYPGIRPIKSADLAPATRTHTTDATSKPHTSPVRQRRRPSEKPRFLERNHTMAKTAKPQPATKATAKPIAKVASKATAKCAAKKKG